MRTNVKAIKDDSKIIRTPEALKKRLHKVADEIKGQKLFENKIEAAKNSLEGLTSLPS